MAAPPLCPDASTDTSTDASTDTSTDASTDASMDASRDVSSRATGKGGRSACGLAGGGDSGTSRLTVEPRASNSDWGVPKTSTSDKWRQA